MVVVAAVTTVLTTWSNAQPTGMPFFTEIRERATEELQYPRFDEHGARVTTLIGSNYLCKGCLFPPVERDM